MSQLTVDVDAEAVFFENAWCTQDDLARRIKTMLDAGDFAIAKASAALEHLSDTLRSVRTLAFRVTPDLVRALEALSARTGRPMSQLLREATGELIAAARPTAPPIITFAPAPTPSAQVTIHQLIARDSEPTVEVSGLDGRWFRQ